MGTEMHERCGVYKDKKEITPRQEEYVKAYRKHGTQVDAANAMGVTAKHFQEMIREAASRSGLNSSSEFIKGIEYPPKQRMRQGLVPSDVATKQDLLDLIRAQGYRCALSGARLTPELASIDHIKPLSEGGTDTVENLQWLHKDINRMKGVIGQDAFIKWCGMVADNHRSPTLRVGS